jgi:hypothetical protein
MSSAATESSNTKVINITGVAATNGMTGGAKTRRRRRTSKQLGGAGEASATAPQEPIIAPTMNVIRQMGSAAPTAGPAPAPPLAPPSAQTGGAAVTNAAASVVPAKQKISLLPAKQKNKTRVLLTPKAQQPFANKQQAGAHHKTTSQTRRQKKFSIRVSALRRKVASTRKHIHASTALPIDKIRKELVDAKLLNPASKAPEALIRKIYADYKITTAK